MLLLSIIDDSNDISLIDGDTAYFAMFEFGVDRSLEEDGSKEFLSILLSRYFLFDLLKLNSELLDLS